MRQGVTLLRALIGKDHDNLSNPRYDRVMTGTGKRQTSVSLRRRLLSWVGALVLLSLLGSALSVYRISEVSQNLDRINRVSVPLGRLLVQLQSDVEGYRREVERRVVIAMGAGRPPVAVPQWIEDVIANELVRVRDLLTRDEDLRREGSSARWLKWEEEIASQFGALREKVRVAAAQVAVDGPALLASLDNWTRQVQWGAAEHDRIVRGRFSRAENQVAQLRTGLEIILVAVVALSLLILWLGERALRPLSQLSALVRLISDRGVRREDKESLPRLAAGRTDEIGILARDFHQMATVLLEREKEVEQQSSRLEEQNRLLRDAGELNWNILASIKSALVVTDAQGVITQCNPAAATWMGRPAEECIGVAAAELPALQAFASLSELELPGKLEPTRRGDRVFGGRVQRLRSGGRIVMIDDLTDELAIQDRLREAENLAAVGRMSAQVAHEVRNPLHSIGLEAELALDSIGKQGDPSVKSSLFSILQSVDRLETITENYLRLSKLSSGRRAAAELSQVLESVLAMYAPVCESQGLEVDWRQVGLAAPFVEADRPILDQCLGNLMSNALQALYEFQQSDRAPSQFVPRIRWSYGVAESGRSWLKVEDNGPGIHADVRDRLFQPFVTGRAQGTGLGLSFVKKVVEDHGGQITAIANGSDPLYPGACFEITFPFFESVPVRSSNEVAL